MAAVWTAAPRQRE